ncbi:MAG TPA: hypothetical protein VES39_05350 [Rhodospirillales bacterium]|nr:hypothetical protein [Rhodospirillales bacterium]
MNLLPETPFAWARSPDLPAARAAGSAVTEPVIASLALTAPAASRPGGGSAAGRSADLAGSGGAAGNVGRRSEVAQTAGGADGPAGAAAADGADAPGFSWRNVYDSELRKVFLDIVERGSERPVMRIPPESLVRFLRKMAETLSGGESAATDRSANDRAPVDLVA